jgi:hypothetical protein
LQLHHTILLVDVDYDGKIFDMDRTVFAKDICADGMIKMTGLTESVARWLKYFSLQPK